MAQELMDKIEEFFDKIRKYMEKHGFSYISTEKRNYWRMGITLIDNVFKKNDKYVSIELMLIDNRVKDIIIYDNDNILDDDLYNKINAFFSVFWLIDLF